MNLEKYILDTQIRNVINGFGISDINVIQIDAIKKGLFFHKNLLVSAPSSSGKTMIGVLAITNTLFSGIGTAMFLVPYKALASQKEEEFKDLFGPYNFHVKAITGDTEPEDMDLTSIDLAITTYEKCDALLRSDHFFLKSVKTIIIDEIHEINQEGRGARLEYLIIRLLQRLSMVQMIGITATLSNASQLTLWLSSLTPNSRKFGLIYSDKRPVELQYELNITENKIKTIREYIDKNLSENGQIIIFVNRRKDCIKLCNTLKNSVKSYLDDGEKIHAGNIKLSLERHRSLAHDLMDVVQSGIAYHNASLGAFERDIVEENFARKVIKIIVATTTLSSGINTPARTVIVYDPIQFRNFINVSHKDLQHSKNKLSLGDLGGGYIRPHSRNIMFQMLGRAGRRGFDNVGIGVILLRNQAEYDFARTHYFEMQFKDNKLQPKYTAVESQINNKDFLQEMILVEIAGQNGLSEPEIRQQLNNTLLSHALFQTNQNHHHIDMLQYLFIQKMDPSYFLRLMGTSPHPQSDDSISNFRFRVIEEDKIEISLDTSTNRYHVSVSQDNGFDCSCSQIHNYKCDNDNDITVSQKLCSHLTYVIDHIFKKIKERNYTSSEEQYHYLYSYKVISNLIPILMKHEYIIPFLLSNELIAYNRKNQRYYPTRYGSLALSLFLSPTKIIFIEKLLKSRGLKSHKMRLKNLIQFHVKFLHGSNMSKKYNDIFNIIHLWIEEEKLQNIRNIFPKYGVGDIFYLKTQIERTSIIFKALSEYINRSELAKHFLVLSQRIKYGVKSELVGLMEDYPNISRNRARIFFNSGYNSSRTIENDDLLTIHTKTNISMVKLNRILAPEKQVRQMNLLEF